MEKIENKGGSKHERKKWKNERTDLSSGGKGFKEVKEKVTEKGRRENERKEGEQNFVKAGRQVRKTRNEEKFFLSTQNLVY